MNFQNNRGKDDPSASASDYLLCGLCYVNMLRDVTYGSVKRTIVNMFVSYGGGNNRPVRACKMKKQQN